MCLRKIAGVNPGWALDIPGSLSEVETGKEGHRKLLSPMETDLTATGQAKDQLSP